MLLYRNFVSVNNYINLYLRVIYSLFIIVNYQLNFNKGIYHNQYTEYNRKLNNDFTDVEIERVEYS